VLVRALADAGVPGIVVPACPSCGQEVPLRFRLGEVRCCRRCYDRGRLEACSRCGRVGDVASRTAAGDAVCSACFRRDPANHGQCSNCGRTALTVRRDDGTAWCRRCYRVPTATCSLCGRDKPCYLVSAGTPRCEHCSRQMRRVPCARCGNSRAVWARTADSQPLCGSCSRERVPCSTCGKTRTVAARLPRAPCAARATARTRHRSSPARTAGPPNASTTTGCAPAAPPASTCSACSPTTRAACTRTPRRSTTSWPPATRTR
jgi:hypothetical protein